MCILNKSRSVRKGRNWHMKEPCVVHLLEDPFVYNGQNRNIPPNIYVLYVWKEGTWAARVSLFLIAEMCEYILLRTIGSSVYVGNVRDITLLLWVLLPPNQTHVMVYQFFFSKILVTTAFAPVSMANFLPSWFQFLTKLQGFGCVCFMCVSWSVLKATTASNMHLQ